MNCHTNIDLAPTWTQAGREGFTTATVLLVSLVIRLSVVNNSLGVLDGHLDCWWAS